MAETTVRRSIRPVSREEFARNKQREREMQEAFGDMEFVQDLETKGFSDPLVRLGYGSEGGEGTGARIIPTRLNAAGVYAPEGSRQLDRFRQESGFTAGDVGDVYTTGDFQGSNTVWSHELRHRGLQRLKNYVGEDVDGFIENYLPDASPGVKNIAGYLFSEGPAEEVLMDFMDHDSPEEIGFPLEELSDDTQEKSEDTLRRYAEVKEAILQAAADMNREAGAPPRTHRWDDPEPETEKKGFWGRLFGSYNKGGLVTPNAMSDYFMASSGQMSEMEFVGKHKMSTKEFENKFEEENNVDISGAENLKEITGKPQGDNMRKQMSFFNEGGMAAPRVDPVSGNDVPTGSLPEEVRDDVPAMLSEGEYVVPADVVRFFGVNFFEQLRTQAKQGMDEMVADDRVGGQPTDAPPQVSPEDMQVITQMAEGGIIDSNNVEGLIDRVVDVVKKNPELSGVFQRKGIMMAEGGLVTDPDAAQSTFDPSQYSAIGFTNPGQTTGGYEYQQYYGPDGTPLMVLFVNGMPAQSIPEGYSTTPPAPQATTPVRQGGDRDRQRAMTPTGTGETTGGVSFGDPLGGLDFSDEDSIKEWATDRLTGGDRFAKAGARMVGGVLGGIPGLIGAGAVRGFDKALDIGAVNAAAFAAEAAGNTTLAESLREQALEARESFGLLGLAPESLMDGVKPYQNYVNRIEETNLGTRPTAGISTGRSSTSGGTSKPKPTYADGDSGRERTVKDSGVSYTQTSRSDDDDTFSSRVATGSTAPTTTARPGPSRPTSTSRPTSSSPTYGGGKNYGGGAGRNRGGLVTRPGK